MNFTPFFEYQQGRKECGLTCLKMIANYYGKSYSLEYLRSKCTITEKGISFLNLRLLAENIGFATCAVSYDYETLYQKVSLPCIVHWKASHFIVVYKITKTKVYIADPAYGLLCLGKDEFIKSWYKESKITGDTIIFAELQHW